MTYDIDALASEMSGSMPTLPLMACGVGLGNRRKCLVAVLASLRPTDVQFRARPATRIGLRQRAMETYQKRYGSVLLVLVLGAIVTAVVEWIVTELLDRWFKEHPAADAEECAAFFNQLARAA